MDPHQNFQNTMLNNPQQQMQQNQYAPMMLQQQYMNNFPNFYGNNQMAVDPFHQQQQQQQQQYLQMQMQQNSMNMFQQQHPAPQQPPPHQPPPHHNPQHQQQQAILLQQQQQRPIQQQQHPQQPPNQHLQFHQQAQMHQHSQPMSHQQQLFQEQQRQLEQQRIQQQQMMEEHRMREQRQKEQEREEARRREQERRVQMEKEREEERKKMEEAMRMEEERRKKEEKERIEKENLKRIRQEQIKKQMDSELATKEMRERLQTICQPLSLAGTHFLSDLRTMIPIPMENLTATNLCSVFPETDKLASTLQSIDLPMIKTISDALSKVAVTDIHTRLDLIEPESNDLPFAALPEIVRTFVEICPEAFDVEPEHNVEDLNLFDIELTGDEPPKLLQQLAGSAPETKRYSQPTSHHEIPSTSRDPMADVQRFHVQIDQNEAAKLRKQMISMGKGPKGAQRRKRDMVESLYDSLTDYFDPSDGQRRRRGRTRTADGEDEDEQLKRDLELIAQMEAAERGERLPNSHLSDAASESDEDGKKSRKRGRKEEERPPTPTEIIRERDLEWNERQRKKQDKRKRRRVDQEEDIWNNETMAENDSHIKFTAILDGILEQVEDISDIMAANGKPNNEEAINEEDDDDDVDPELLIDRAILEDLRCEAIKLKDWRRLNKIQADRLVKLIYILERNMRDVISQDGSRLRVPLFFDEDGEEDEAAFKELVGDRLMRACDAANTALTIMTSHKMPKQVYIEDAIDRAINLCKHYLNYIVFPASDSLFRSSNKKKIMEDGRRKKKTTNTNNRSKFVEEIYSRISTLVRSFGQLIRIQSLPETSIHHLASLAISTFFVNNVGTLQYEAVNLASNIFSIAGDDVRTTMLTDILNSFHRLPHASSKNFNNSRLVGTDLWINNTTLLVMQLIQSVVKIPKRKKNDEEDRNDLTPDTIVKDSFREAQKLAGKFLQGFISKCSCKGSKSEGEEDYRRIFDGFLQDLLAALYKPEWPAAEMMLSLLGTLLVQHYRNKQTDLVIRQACLDYLGTITARLRKDMKMAVEDSEKRMEIVVKTLLFEEQEEGRYMSVHEVDISSLSTTDRLKKLEQALIDYLVETKGENVSVEYAVVFYAGEWYKETAEDLDMAKKKFKQELKEEMNDKERRKLEKRQDRMMEKGASMKEFLIKLVDKKHMRKRSQFVSRDNVMMESDAAWAVKYLASRREFSHSFEGYLRQILFGVTAETTVGLRTKAMKCLTQIIEADHEVLGMTDVLAAVKSRMMDPNAAVREATIELLGKFLLVKEEFIPNYYNILLERIKDSGTAVRKRVIRIMKEICEKYPNFEKIPDMLAKLVRRIVDDDGVKKLVQDTFSALWFNPCHERHPEILVKKVIQMTAVAQLCAAEQTIDFLEQLLQSVLKQGEKPSDGRDVIFASKQIVDSLVDNILVLERNLAADVSTVQAHLNGEDLTGAQIQKTNQDRLLACLTTLSIFSKVRPELLVAHSETLQPYLSMTAVTAPEQQVLNEVINMLERIVPLMSHPNDNFLHNLDESLAVLASNAGMVIVESAIRSASAVWHKFPRKVTALAPKFLFHLRNLNSMKQLIERDKNYQIPQNRIPQVQRSVFTIGLLARYFNFDIMLENDEDAAKNLIIANLSPAEALVAGGDSFKLTDEEETESRKYRDNVFSLLCFFSRNAHQQIRQRSISSIGHLCAQYADYLARPEVKNMYVFVLQASQPEHLALKIQILKNLEMFLSNEDKKAIKCSQEWDKNKEYQNLKEMELAGSGLSSAVIQIYWNLVLNCYFHPNEMVRSAAAQVTCLTLNQGLVTPTNSIPTLIAMTTDPVHTIRIKVENLLKEIDTKYAGMVQAKAINGVRIAFKLNCLIKSPGTPVVRGIRSCDASVMTQSRGRDSFGLPRMTNDGQAILSGLYTSLRGSRTYRRSFLNNILNLFSEGCRDKPSLEEWIFVADNIAMFPYQVIDEPLYAIKQIDSIITQTGLAIVGKFRSELILAQQMEDDELFKPENLFQRFPDDKTNLFRLMVESQACFILLYLKNFLIKLYGFNQTKIQEYGPSDAAKIYEKPVTRKNIYMFQPDSALQELRPEVVEERYSLQGTYQLAHKIHSFRSMLLGIANDRLEDDDIDDEGQTTGVTEREEDEEDHEEISEEIQTEE